MTVLPATAVQPYVLVVRALLQDPAGRYLLMRRSSRCQGWPGKWEFPGGKVEPGEEIASALAREVREETAMELTACQLMTALEWPRERDNILYLFFRVRTTGGEPSLSAEHDAMGWYDPSQMKTLDLSPPLVRLWGMLP